MIKLMFICNDPELAHYAVASGVNRIFVDLEIHGKYERQGHRDTVISAHALGDVERVRAATGNSELLVRVNPLFDGTAEEVDGAIDAGADFLMLPMFETADQVAEFTGLVRGRAKVIPLVETPMAADNLATIVALPDVDEIYIGLNDLHMALGLDFMFELLADGSVDRMAEICRQAGMPFGFGGIARMDEGLLPGEIVLAEHLRLGSSAVILSRTFHRASISLDQMHTNIDFEHEVSRLREHEARLAQRSRAEIDADRQALLDGVNIIASQIRSRMFQ